MRRFQKGFSLVELMIVVAIIGILAAIAIPNFITMQLKAKRSEVPGNVDGIKTSEVAYDAAFDGYLDLTASPVARGDKEQIDWVAVGAEWTSLGWAPDGRVRGQYSAVATGNTDGCTGEMGAATWTATSTTAPNFCVHGSSDVDGDAIPANFYADLEHNSSINPDDASKY